MHVPLQSELLFIEYIFLDRNLPFKFLNNRRLLVLLLAFFLKMNGECQRDQNVNPLFFLPKATKFEKRALIINHWYTFEWSLPRNPHHSC